jgi:hypothetical protein
VRALCCYGRPGVAMGAAPGVRNSPRGRGGRCAVRLGPAAQGPTSNSWWSAPSFPCSLVICPRPRTTSGLALRGSSGRRCNRAALRCRLWPRLRGARPCAVARLADVGAQRVRFGARLEDAAAVTSNDSGRGSRSAHSFRRPVDVTEGSHFLAIHVMPRRSPRAFDELRCLDAGGRRWSWEAWRCSLCPGLRGARPCAVERLAGLRAQHVRPGDRLEDAAAGAGRVGWAQLRRAQPRRSSWSARPSSRRRSNADAVSRAPEPAGRDELAATISLVAEIAPVGRGADHETWHPLSDRCGRRCSRVKLDRRHEPGLRCARPHTVERLAVGRAVMSRMPAGCPTSG